MASMQKVAAANNSARLQMAADVQEADDALRHQAAVHALHCCSCPCSVLLLLLLLHPSTTVYETVTPHALPAPKHGDTQWQNTLM